ncbi:MAG: DUF2878 domain-containing protein [Wenzhouxiangellaceae bacterium]|nr:DUF2878 domain-containing protein [Wenzhouxiangellaceae bacterium]
MNRRDFWINQGFFQLAWPACVVGAAFGQLWPSVLLVTLFAGWQFSGGRAHADDARTALWFLACGLVLDTLWQQLGIVSYALAWPLEGFAPLWLMLLWLALAMTVHHSLAVFQQRWWLFTVAASIGSPLSYLAAARLGAVEWTAPSWLVVLCIGPVWALLVGLLFRQAGRMTSRTAVGSLAAEGAGR